MVYYRKFQVKEVACLEFQGVRWNGRAALAPMAGVADKAFREICVKFGAGYTVTEMVSAKGLCMQDRKSRELLELSAAEHPAAAQIFGDDPVFMAKAAEKCLSFSPDVIDINMGCPAPKIAGNGGGCALMRQPELAQQIVAAVCRAVPIPVSVKMRVGWDAEHVNCVELAKRCEQAGAAMLTVHGRTKMQMYAPPVLPEPIAAVRRAVKIPVAANGEVTDGVSAAKLMEQTGCEAVMVGRGSLGRPWVFRQIEAYLADGTVLPEPPAQERMAVMLEHIERTCSYKGQKVAMLEARKHAAWYMKGIRGAAALRREICELKTLDELRAIAEKAIEAANAE